MTWVAYQTDDQYKRTYYYNETTGVTTWDRPEGYVDESNLMDPMSDNHTTSDFQMNPLQAVTTPSITAPPLPKHLPKQISISRLHSRPTPQQHTRQISSNPISSQQQHERQTSTIPAVIPIGYQPKHQPTSSIVPLEQEHTRNISRAPLAYIDTNGTSTDAFALNKFNIPGQPIWKRHPRRVGVIVFTILSLLAIGGVVAYFLMRPAHDTATMQRVEANNALQAQAQQYYNPSTKTITLPTLPNNIFNFTQSSVLTGLFAGLTKGVNGINTATIPSSISNLLLTGVTPINNLLQGFVPNFTSINNIQSWIPIITQSGILPEPLSRLLTASISHQAYSGILNVPLGSVGAKLLGATNVPCTFVTFFAPFEKTFTLSSIHYALHCSIQTSWNEQNLFRNTTHSSWFSQLSITGNGTLLISTLTYEETLQQSVVPAYIDRGVTIFADVIPNAIIPSNQVLGGINTLLSNSLAQAHVQVAFPMGITPDGSLDWSTIVSNVRGNVWIDTGILAAAGSVVVSTNGINIGFHGQNASLAEIDITTNIQLSINNGKFSDQFTVTGNWDNIGNILQLNGKLDGIHVWNPLSGKYESTNNIAILSNMDVSLTFNTLGHISLIRGTYDADVTFNYGTSLTHITSQASGSFTSTEFLLVVQSHYAVDLQGLITLLSQGQSTKVITDNIFLSTSGTVDIVVSTYKSSVFSTLLGTSVQPGLSLNIHSQSLLPTSSSATQIAKVLSLIQSTTTTFDILVTLPFTYNNQISVTSVTVGITAKNVPLGPVTLQTFHFGLNIVNGQTNVDMEAAASFPLPNRVQPLSVQCNVTVSNINGATRFLLQGTVDSLSLNVFDISWLYLDNTLFTASILTGSNVPDIQIAFTTQASFQFKNLPRGTPIPLGVSIAQKIVTLYARNIQLSSLHPDLAAIAGIGTQPWDLVITTATGAPKISFNPQSKHHDIHIMNTHAFHMMDISIPPIIPAGITTGLNLYSQFLTLKQGAWNTLMQGIDMTYTTDLFNVTIHLPFSLEQTWKARIGTAHPLTFAPAVTLNQTIIEIDVTPRPLTFGAYIGAQATFHIPKTQPAILDVVGSYNSTLNQLILNGHLNEIDAPFGQSWLSIHPSLVQFEMISTTKVASLASGATFLDTVDVDVCAWVGTPTSAIKVNAGINHVSNTLCRLFNVCGNVTNGILESLGLNDIQLLAILTSDALHQGDVTGTVCTIPYDVKQGITLASNLQLGGEFLNKLKTWFGTGITNLINNWILSLNLPFALPNIARHRAQVMSYTQNPSLANVDHPALRHLTMAQHHARFRSLSLLDTIDKFSINYERHDLTLNINNWFAITGLGIMVNPTVGPSPIFSVWCDLSIMLKNQESPLLFHGQGSGSAIGVTISASLTSQTGWKNAFGLKGMTVYGATATIGFGVTGLTAFGLGFAFDMGRIAIIFDGTVSLDNIANSYLMASLHATDNGALALCDFIQAIQTMAGSPSTANAIWNKALPSPAILSITDASFSIATADGITNLGRPIHAGFNYNLNMTLLGIKVTSSGGTRPYILNNIPLTDFYFNFAIDFNAWNTGIVQWVRARLSFLNVLLDSNASLCNIACIKSLVIDDLSVLGWTQGRFPAITLSVALFGQTFDLTTTQLTQDILALNDPAKFLDIFNLKNNFGCIADENCPTNQKCNHFQLPFKCVDPATACGNGFTWANGVGCIPGSWTPTQCGSDKVWIPVIGCQKKWHLFGAFADVLPTLVDPATGQNVSVSAMAYSQAGAFFDPRQPIPLGMSIGGSAVEQGFNLAAVQNATSWNAYIGATTPH